jgi:hypothetical protein
MAALCQTISQISDEEDYYLFAGPCKNKDDQLEDIKRIDRVLENYTCMKFITPAEFLQKMFPDNSNKFILL